MEREKAKHILRQLDFDDWLMAGVVFPPKTTTKKRMRKLEDLIILLEPNEKMFPSVNLQSVAEWIEHKIGDEALARELYEIDAKGELSYLQKCLASHKAVQKRCDELRGVCDA